MNKFILDIFHLQTPTVYRYFTNFVVKNRQDNQVKRENKDNNETKYHE